MPQEPKVPGPIEGLRLPIRAWEALRKERITTIDQLRAAVDRIERFSDIGPKTAEVIRAELARVTSLKEHTPNRPSEG
jgi:DNA-directed RNA polymerase alpha subunit